MVWPSPEAVTLTLWSGESRARLLPVLPAERIRCLAGFSAGGEGPGAGAHGP